MNRNLRIILGVIGLILLCYVLWNVRTIIYYFFTATIIAFIGRPLIALLGRIKIKDYILPNWLKSLLVLLSFGLLLFGFFQLIIPTVISQANIISNIDPNMMVEKLEPQIQKFTGWMGKFDIQAAEIEKVLVDEISKIFQVGQISDYLTSIISGLTDTLIAVFSILFISFFLLKDGTIVDNVVTSLNTSTAFKKSLLKQRIYYPGTLLALCYRSLL